MDPIASQPDRAGLAVFPGAPAAVAAQDHDWAATPLGAPDQWPQSLKTAASMVLGSTVPMFLAWGPDLLMVFNDAYGDLLGDRNPALGRPVREIWADAWERIRPNAERAMAGETLYFESEPRRLARHGGESETIWLTYCYNPVLGEDGRIAGLFGTVVAVGRDADAEDRVRESEERFRLIADSAPVPIWVTKLDRKRGYVNRAYVEFLGITYEEAVDYDWRDIIHPDDAVRIRAESLAGEASLALFTLEARFRRCDGEWRWLRSISQPRWGAHGEHVGFIGVAHDITEWRLGNEALREVNEVLERRVEGRTADLSAALERLRDEVGERERAEDALRQAQKMEAVGRLTGGIAHDFNNLLTPVIGGLEVIAGSVEEPRLKRLADAALESGKRGAKLATQLLAFSRIQRLRMAPVPVERVIANLSDILRHTIGGDIRITTDLGASGAHAMCDENQLENAILNLAINARDAMPDGGTLAIATAREPQAGAPDLAEGDYVRITVADTGFGMAPDILARATEPFFSTKPFGKGTGLGLAQVYGIARQSGGTVRIESEEGRGTRVHILLSAAAAPAETEGTDTARARTPALATPAARILIVDDDADVRAFVADTLESFGHDVTACADGETALARLAEANPDLVLIDFTMPGMNGAELASALRTRQPGLPMAFVTGYAETEQLEAALGPDVPVLRKPFGVADLATLVGTLVGAARG